MSLLYELVVQEDLNLGTTANVDVTAPDGGDLAGTKIGLHTFAVGLLAQTATWNPASISASGYESKSISVPGAVVGDHVMVSLSTMVTNDMQLTGHVSAADTVLAVLFNPTVGAINLAEGVLSALVFKVRSAA